MNVDLVNLESKLLGLVVIVFFFLVFKGVLDYGEFLIHIGVIYVFLLVLAFFDVELVFVEHHVLFPGVERPDVPELFPVVLVEGWQHLVNHTHAPLLALLVRLLMFGI